MNRHARQLSYLYISTIVVYLALVFATKPTTLELRTFGVSELKYWVIVFSAEFLLAFIWLAAFYGFIYLYNYASTIKVGSKEGKPINRLTKGIGLLVFQLPIASLLGELLRLWAQHNPRFVPTSTIMSHYISMILPLIAFIYISYGARGLTDIVKQRPRLRAIHILAILFIVTGAAFTYLMFKGVPNSVIASSLDRATYYLPGWLLLFTLVMPYIYTWFIGLLAAYEIYLYMLKAPGIIYRQALMFLAYGIGIIIAVSIASQYITALTRIRILQINALLILIYGLLTFLAVGYVLIALGAKKLQRIEEV